jgi:hypothetical protein
MDYSYYLVWAGLFATFYLVRNVAPNTNMKDWARDEAEERFRRREAGLPVEFGQNYAVLKAEGVEPAPAEE